MSELDEYRERLAAMRLGQLVEELIELKLTDTPDEAKKRILQVQKLREVKLELNSREVHEDARVPESRETKVRSLKNIL